MSNIPQPFKIEYQWRCMMCAVADGARDDQLHPVPICAEAEGAEPPQQVQILVVNDLDVEVRAGTIADVPVLLSFIRSMAAFEKLTVTATEESLQAAFFGEAPAARSLLAFVDGKPVAYATYFFTFATMEAKRGLWLDDLFIDAAFRGKGIGQALMAYLADVAVQNHCGRFEWMVLDWNEGAIGFYKRLGATVLPGWRICRLDEGQLSSVASQLAIAKGR